MFSSSSGDLERRFPAEFIFWTLLNKASRASPTPKGVYLWTFMAHWWTFLTKKTPHHPISCASPTPKGRVFKIRNFFLHDFETILPSYSATICTGWKNMQKKMADFEHPTPKGGYLWTFENKNLWTFMAHWWTFLTIKTPHHPISCASPTPKGVYLWTFKNNNSWTFMAHWWTFLTKKNKIFLSKNE